MDRCNELCTKETTGQCALCDALAKRDRFEWFRFKGGLFVDGVHAMQRRGVFTFLRRYAFPFVFFSCVGLMLWLAWLIPRSTGWHSTVSRFMHENPVFVVVLLISLLVPLFWLLLWRLPQWQVAAVPEMKDRIDLESKSRQTLAQILGGAALLVGLYFTSQTLRTTQEGQITDRFTKAIDQLGKDTLAVRLGGIYALERIARDSESDHWAVMEVLTAFVREQAPATPLPPDKPSGEKEAEESSHERKLPSDIQAILTVIGRRTRTFENGEIQSLDLHNTNLQGARLERAQLQGADLGGAQLQDALLAFAQLQDAVLAFAQLQDAHLERAQLQGALLAGAQLQGAHLVGAELQGARLQGAQLQDAVLAVAQLQGADLGGAELQGAHLEGAQLQGAHLEGAELQGAHLTLVENLTQDQINTACLDEHTTLPKGLTRPAPCPTHP